MGEKTTQRTLHGVHRAEVTDNVDPLAGGRVEVRLKRPAERLGRDVRMWAPWCSPYADDGQGLQIVPEVGSDVIVAFEGGDPDRPIVLGALWGPGDAPPQAPHPANDMRVLATRSGSRLEFDDAAHAPAIRLTTAAGHRIVLEDDDVTISHAGGGSVRLAPGGIVEITAGGILRIQAATVDVSAAVANFAGVVTCENLIASNSVISPRYSPGEGNVW